MATKIKLGNGNWGVKDGGTLAYNDENGVFKAIELASSRASGATYVAQSGLIADAEVGVPRIDWTNGVGELLLEPQSTNLIPYSEDFTDASWSKSSGGTGVLPVVTANQGISPDGTLNADRIQLNLGGGLTTSDISTVSQSVTMSGVNSNNRSIYIKSYDGSSYDILFGTNDISNAFSKITITSEWQRFDVTQSSPSDAITNIYFGLRNLSGFTNQSDTADILVWGAQLEELSYPTSYIRTSGSSVTRIADAVPGNSSLGQVINSSEGVLYVESSALNDNTTPIFISLSDNTTSNRICIYFQDTRIRGFIIQNSGSTLSFSNTTVDVSSFHKIAISYTNDEARMFIDGSFISSIDLTSVAFSGDLNRVDFANGGGGTPFYGRVRELKVYDTALTDAELTALTTL